MHREVFLALPGLMMQPRLRVCPALAYTRESGNPSEKLVMGKSGLSGRGRKDGGGVRGGGAQMRNPEE